MFNWFKKKQRGCAHAPNLSPAEDFAIAQSEYAASNLTHAAYHLGCALASDPERREYLELLERMSDVSRDPLDLAPLGEKNYFATMAVRAYLLHRLNRLDQAVDLILQVALTKTDVPYIKWAIRWVQEPRAAGRIEDGVSGFLLQIYQDKLQLWESGLESGGATLDHFPELARALFASGSDNVQMLYIAAVLVRKLGWREEAIALAQELYRRHAGYEPAVAVAYALREHGRREEAYQAFQVALQHRPNDAPVYLELGDMRWDDGDWEGAAYHYGLVLQQEPQHEWALPSSYAVQFRKTGDPEWREAVERLAQEGNDRARTLMFQIGMDLQTYVPEPSDATVNVGHQVVSEFADKPPHERPQKPVKITLSALEPPSALLAVNCEMRLSGLPYPATVQIPNIAAPDPRQPYGKADYVLWRYQGVEAVPNYPPPPPRVVDGISRIAAQPYGMQQWSEWGRGLAAELGRVPVEQLLGAMVHPPDRPPGMYSWTWINRFQLAAVYAVAGRETGWTGTERRRVLLSLARGPLDWTVSHALIVLAAVAREVPESVPEIAELHLDRLRGAPQEGAVCYVEPLCLAALHRPGLDPVEREHWLDILKRVTED